MPPALIDTHCHLDVPPFVSQLDTVLADAGKKGVCRFILPGVEAAGWDNLLRVVNRSPAFFAAPGIHPLFCKNTGDAEIAKLDSLLCERRRQVPAKIVAIGEIGLDFWPSECDEEQQRRIFEAQLDLAEHHRLPVLLHVRKAHDAVLALLRRRKLSAGGIVHAFSGSLQQAEQYAGLGFFPGFGGGITWPRARRLRRIATSFPLEKIVLETDAPNMPLYGHQGHGNHPALLAEVLTCLAELRGMEEEDLAAEIWQNSCAILQLPMKEEKV
ncbi:TatD family hydrolase [Desulforhopalus vacuolatus]|uniref:TatD family hydrolase n=1 Tax=Desulforhopalus vacuolatus TaxID=40414 RepID=UPI001966A037|nr:TatD family hydrolase [Desulforhopalus vacuolatus]MBM9519413.1 TatD family hydrolase [Desulforhopalus vacuolatus]